MQSSMMVNDIQLTCVPEQTEVAASAAQHQMLGLVHIQAPALVSDERASRAPIAVSAVIDRSGSMSGEKMNLVKKTLTFVIRNLKDDDQLGIVAYDDQVTENLPLIHMNAKGRKQAIAAVNALAVGGSTNLSGGLFGGLNQLQGLPVVETARIPPQTINIPLIAPMPQTQLMMPTQAKHGGFFKSLANSVSSAFGGHGSSLQKSPSLSNTRRQSSISSGSSTAIATPIMPSVSANDKGKQVAQQRQAAAAVADVSAVWLFTDGQANAGITNTEQLKAEVQRRLTQMAKPCSVFTFGFGSDHDSAMLNAISEAGNGMYYFVETEDKIPDAFSDCLGGLLSVVAQNLKLTLRPEPGCTLVKVHTAYTHEINANNQATVRLPDIYSEEARDIIVEFRLETLSQPRIERGAVLRCTLDYFNVIASTQATASAEMTIARPAVAQTQPVPPELDQQRNRIRCAEAMKEAQQMAEDGKLVQAQQMLRDHAGLIQQSSTGADEKCQAMIANLEECVANMSNECEYRALGCKVMLSHQSAHAYQRSSCKSVSYATPMKKMMQEKFRIGN